MELHLETDNPNHQRKKSSSAIAEEEIIVKKTSKSCSDVTANAAGVVMACANIVSGNEVFLSEAATIRKDSKASNCSVEEACAANKALTFKANLGKRDNINNNDNIESFFQRRRRRLKEAQKVPGRMAALGSAARKFVPGKMSEYSVVFNLTSPRPAISHAAQNLMADSEKFSLKKKSDLKQI